MRFRIHNVDLKEWCERYEIEPFEVSCPTCGRLVVVDKPFAGEKGLRGLEADQCECGDTNAPQIWTSPELNKLGG